MDIAEAKERLETLIDKPKYEAMLYTAAIITQLLDKYGIKPIIVGGLSVEIYTQSEYATRDIDFVSDGYHIIEDILFSLGFQKEGRHFFHSEIEIAIEIPDSDLAGSYDKVAKVEIDEKNYIYLISVEDIILDRLRATVNWRSEEDRIWGFKLLASNYEIIDLDYLKNHTETVKEAMELNDWIQQIQKEIN